MTATHTEIRDDLRRRINAGEFAPGENLPDLPTLPTATGRRTAAAAAPCMSSPPRDSWS